MKKLAYLTGGVLLGFVLAHFVNSTAAGRQFFAKVNRAVEEFRYAVIAGYVDAESEQEELTPVTVSQQVEQDTAEQDTVEQDVAEQDTVEQGGAEK